MANRARQEGDPSGWFDPFYQWAEEDEARIPWADLAPHPLLVDWMHGKSLSSVAVVGCGLGDDAEALSVISKSVWAFDVSPTAIEWTQRRHPNSMVEYGVADLYALDSNRLGQYGTVVEIYTLQALPPESRRVAQAALVSLLTDGGELIVITRWREPESELGPVPWPLLNQELDFFEDLGLERIEQTGADPGHPIRVVWKKRNNEGMGFLEA